MTTPDRLAIRELQKATKLADDPIAQRTHLIMANNILKANTTDSDTLKDIDALMNKALNQKIENPNGIWRKKEDRFYVYDNVWELVKPRKETYKDKLDDWNHFRPSNPSFKHTIGTILSTTLPGLLVFVTLLRFMSAIESLVIATLWGSLLGYGGAYLYACLSDKYSRTRYIPTGIEVYVDIWKKHTKLDINQSLPGEILAPFFYENQAAIDYIDKLPANKRKHDKTAQLLQHKIDELNAIVPISKDEAALLEWKMRNNLN